MLSRQLQIRIKYALDRVLGAVLVLALSPIYLLVAVVIKVDSRGPVLFCQQRVGFHERPFTVFKFRTMVDDADRQLREQGFARSDQVTRVGRILRRTSIDELPQLFNILLGQMSFIGPRPGLENRHVLYTARQRRRCEMRPGITGLAQVFGRNKLTWPERIEFDIRYVDHYSSWLDAHIVFRTLWVVLTGAGVEADPNAQPAGNSSSTAAATPLKSALTQKDRPYRRVEPVLTGPYRKDPDFEQVLRAMNESLAARHDSELRDLREEYSTIHIIGAPRSGTTLLSQLVSSCLDVGYINNLIATFWRVPCYGIRLSEKLLAGVRPESYHSDYGRTLNIYEPHEFGYFWSYQLGYSEMAEQDDRFETTIDWPRLGRLLINITHEFGKPVVFKSFLLAWHLRKMQQTLPKSIFVWIRRDPIETAISLAAARQAQLGSVEKWISMKPREYTWLQHKQVWTQLAGQVYYLERAISRQVNALGGTNIVELTYDELCADPQRAIDSVAGVLRQCGQEVRHLRSAPRSFERSRNHYADHPLYERVMTAYEAFAREDEDESLTLRNAG